MAFNPRVYWARRDGGMRGQETLTSPPKSVRPADVPVGTKVFQIGTQLVERPANRRERRQKEVDRTMTKKGFRNGLRLR